MINAFNYKNKFVLEDGLYCLFAMLTMEYKGKREFNIFYHKGYPLQPLNKSFCYLMLLLPAVAEQIKDFVILLFCPFMKCCLDI